MACSEKDRLFYDLLNKNFTYLFVYYIHALSQNKKPNEILKSVLCTHNFLLITHNSSLITHHKIPTNQTSH